MTNGSSTLIRQNVLARMLRSSIAAMKIARMSCGTVDSRKMLKVLRSAVQNCGLLEDPDVLVEPDERAGVADEVPVLERDHGGVGDREQPDDREQDEERGDVEVGRELEVPPAQLLREREDATRLLGGSTGGRWSGAGLSFRATLLMTGLSVGVGMDRCGCGGFAHARTEPRRIHWWNRSEGFDLGDVGVPAGVLVLEAVEDAGDRVLQGVVVLEVFAPLYGRDRHRLGTARRRSRRSARC